MTSPEPAHPVLAWRRAVLAEHDPAHPAALDSSARLVAAVLAEHVDSNGKAWPGADRLSRCTALGLRTVRVRLKMLEDLGWLEVLERGGQPGGPRTSVVRITIPPGVTRAPGARVDGVTRAADAPVDGVARAPGAPVTETTRAPGATTRASGATTRAAGAPELEELEEQERVAADLLSLCRAMVARAPGELPEVLAGAEADHGHRSTATAVVGLHRDGRRFEYPSQLRRAIRERAEVSPRPRTYGSAPECERCEGRGVIDVDPTKNTAQRCPACSPLATVGAA